MYQEDYNRTPAGRPFGNNSLAFASFVLACMAIFSVFTGLFPIMLGSLSLILALLSRGREAKLPPSVKLSTYLAVFAIIAGFIISAMAVHSIMSDPEMMNFVNRLYEALRNMDYDEYTRLLREYYEQHGISTNGMGNL